MSEAAHIRIGRLEVALENLSPELARSVAGGLEHAVAAELRRRLARAGTTGAALVLDTVDLGQLSLSQARSAAQVSQAIASHLAQWVQQQLPAPQEEA